MRREVDFKAELKDTFQKILPSNLMMDVDVQGKAFISAFHSLGRSKFYCYQCNAK